MTPGNIFAHRTNKGYQAKKNSPDHNAYMASYEKQRRYYFRDEDNSRYRYEEQQFESVYATRAVNKH
jgi:hypothetical protein